MGEYILDVNSSGVREENTGTIQDGVSTQALVNGLMTTSESMENRLSLLRYDLSTDPSLLSDMQRQRLSSALVVLSREIDITIDRLTE